MSRSVILLLTGLLLISSMYNCNQLDKQAAASEISSDSLSITRGNHLFTQNCSACHHFDRRNIGPALAGVTLGNSPAWLRSFIRNAPQVIESEDQRAKALFEEYRQYMPAFPQLTDEDLDDLIAFLHTRQKLSKKPINQPKVGKPLDDPIPKKIPHSGIRLVLKKVAQAPTTAKETPLTRINKLLPLPGNSGRLFLHDLRGYLYELRAGRLHLFLDLKTERPAFIDKPGLGTGFGSFAFHPGFTQNGLFYTTHTEPPRTRPADFTYEEYIPVTLQWVVTEWKQEKPEALTFSGSHRELLRIDMVSGIHGVQEIGFNPYIQPGQADYGLLYISVGEGGATLNGYAFLCQSPQRVWGTILRIDPLGQNSANGQYGIPPDNPFAADADPTTLDEVWAGGFRNPHRFSWDAGAGGEMLITDIGQAQVEEINLGQAGANYGWSNREGTFRVAAEGDINEVYELPEDDSLAAYVYPVAQFDHDEGAAISGGFVYRGNQIASFSGKYLFGDIVSGRLFYTNVNDLKLGSQAPIFELSLEVKGRATTFQQLCGNKRADLRLGVDNVGELYLFTKADGVIWKVIEAAN